MNPSSLFSNLHMKRQASFLAIWFAFTLACYGAAPSADKLLPADTLEVFTVPDYPKAKEVTSKWPGAQLMGDMSMKPFIDKFTEKIKSELITPLEREFGLKFSDFAELAQGQVTL